jgi:hypothetical protein
VIPNDAVEAAAKALWTPSNEGDTWESEYEPYKDHTRAEAKRALEAAAPHLMAGAWDEGFDKGFYDPKAGSYWDASESTAVNPHRKPTDARG